MKIFNRNDPVRHGGAANARRDRLYQTGRFHYAALVMALAGATGMLTAVLLSVLAP